MKKCLSLILAVIMLSAAPISVMGGWIWEADTENSFSVDFSDLSSYVGQNVTASNIGTILGSGWSIYNPDNTDVSTTFNIGQQTSASYNKDHTIEIKRTHDSGQYYVVGLKKEFSDVLDGKAKLTFETVSDLNTNIYVYDADGSVIVRLRYHQNAIKLTTAANGTETAICSVQFANSILTWELDFDLEAGEMGLSIKTSQDYSTAPSGAASNLDTSVSKTIKTTTPFTVSNSATDIESFVIGTNTYNYRARVMAIAVEAQKHTYQATPPALVNVTDSFGSVIENETGKVSTRAEYITVNFSHEIKESTVSCLKLFKVVDPTEPVSIENILSDDKKSIKMPFDHLEEGDYLLVIENVEDTNETEVPRTVKEFSVAKQLVSINEDFSEYQLHLDMSAKETNGWEYYNGTGEGKTAIVYDSNAKLNVMGIGPIHEIDSASVTVPFSEQTGRFEIEFPLCNIGSGANPYVELYSGEEKAVRLTLPSRVFRLVTDFTKGDYDDSTIILFGKNNSDYKFGATVPVTVKFTVDMTERTYDLSLTHSTLVGYTGAYNAEAGVTVDTSTGTATIKNVPLAADVSYIDAVKFGSVWTKIETEAPVITLRYLKITSLPSIDSVNTSFGGELSDGNTVSIMNNSFTLNFSDEVNTETLKGIRLITKDGKTEIPLTGNLINSKCYNISFKELMPETEYVLHLVGIKDKLGKLMDNRTKIPFTTSGKKTRVENESFSVSEIGNNNSVTASATLTNETNSEKNAVMLVFQYSAEGIVKSVSASRAKALPAQIIGGELVPGTATLSTEITLKNKAAGDYITVYTWEDLTGGNIISPARSLQ